MGGNVLLGFQEKNAENPQETSTPNWMIVLPKKSVGLAPIPVEKGVIIGGDPRRGGIRHYTEGSLLIGSFRPTRAMAPSLSIGRADSWTLSSQ